MSEGGKRVLIVCALDKFANGLRPIEIQRFLHARGHRVHLFDTHYLATTMTVPGLTLRAVRALHSLSQRWQFFRRRLFYYVVLLDYRFRRKFFESSLPLDDFDLVICDSFRDVGVLTLGSNARTMYDCATPNADELWFEGLLTKRQHQKLRKFETGLFESVDHLAFHWETYARYAIKNYGISGRNLVTMNWGCNPAATRAEFATPPRVVYLGFLGMQFIDLPLLARLSELYPHLDVFGAPPPDPELGLNYLGYAHPSVLQHYQLGLITSTKDELRLSGFSAKHLEYLAYGLPVLVPAARRESDLLKGSIGYEEETFLSTIDSLSDEKVWREVSDEAYAQAQRLAWSETLLPLEGVLAHASKSPSE